MGNGKRPSEHGALGVVAAGALVLMVALLRTRVDANGSADLALTAVGAVMFAAGVALWAVLRFGSRS